jgi:hypothetical protein
MHDRINDDVLDDDDGGSARGNLYVLEEVDIAHGSHTARRRSTKEAIESQLGKKQRPAEMWEELLTLCDDRAVDFMSFNVKAKHIHQIKDANFGGMKYTLRNDFVDYLDGRHRTEGEMNQRDEDRDLLRAEWVKVQKEHNGDLMEWALNRLKKEQPKMWMCVYHHYVRRLSQQQVADMVGYSDRCNVNRSIARGLRRMRVWVQDMLTAKGAS